MDREPFKSKLPAAGTFMLALLAGALLPGDRADAQSALKVEPPAIPVKVVSPVPLPVTVGPIPRLYLSAANIDVDATARVSGYLVDVAL